jgi:uncharacterized protein (DUF58 family)
MIAPDTFRKIRLIELRTRKLVNDSLAGAYHSAFKGRGIEFDALRPYEPGDDVLLIDWNVTARNENPFVRQYIEERELTVMLLLDTSASCLFGTTGKQKRDVGAEVGAILAYSAIRNNDKVGLLLFSTKNELYVPPRKGRNHILRLIRDLLTAKPADHGTDIGAALRMANQSLKRRSIIFVLSDFLAPVETYAKELSLLAYHHDVIALILSDPLEQRWPNVGLTRVQDAETGQQMWIDTHAPRWQAEFSSQSARLRTRLESTLLKSQVDFIQLRTNEDFVGPLTNLFYRRVSSRR